MLLAPPASPELAGEVADLWFHTMLLLARDGVDPLEPLRVLAERARCGRGATDRREPSPGPRRPPAPGTLRACPSATSSLAAGGPPADDHAAGAG